MTERAERNRTKAQPSARKEPKGNKRALILWGGVLAAAVGLVAFGMASSGLFGGGKGSGEPAPDLVLASTSGQQFRLSELNGQPRLLYFSFPG